MCKYVSMAMYSQICNDLKTIIFTIVVPNGIPNKSAIGQDLNSKPNYFQKKKYGMEHKTTCEYLGNN